MKRILIVSTSPIKNDGLSKVIFSIIKFNQDIEFDLAAPTNTQFDLLNEVNPVSTFILPIKRNTFQYMRRINEIVKENSYDLVYLHGNSALMVIEALAIKRNEKTELIAHCHNSSSSSILLHHLCKPMFNHLIDKGIGCSTIARDWAFYENNSIVIPNGISANEYHFSKEKRYQIRKELGVDDQTILIGHFGRFTKQKNHEFLLKVFKEFLKTQESTKLLLIGEGEDKKNIIEYSEALGVGNNLIVLEPHSDIEDYYNALDLMIMPSLYEGLSLVAIEAQANGLPLLVSDTFSPEIFATKYVEKLSLSCSEQEWANKAYEMSTTLQRGDYPVEELERKHLTYSQMMNSIRDVLVDSCGIKE